MAEGDLKEEDEGDDKPERYEGATDAKVYLENLVEEKFQAFWEKTAMPALRAELTNMNATIQGVQQQLDPEQVALQAAAMIRQANATAQQPPAQITQGHEDPNILGGGVTQSLPVTQGPYPQITNENAPQVSQPQPSLIDDGMSDRRKMLTDAMIKLVNGLSGYLDDPLDAAEKVVTVRNAMKGAPDQIDATKITMPAMQELWTQRPREMAFLAQQNMPDPVAQAMAMAIPEAGMTGFKQGFMAKAMGEAWKEYVLKNPQVLFNPEDPASPSDPTASTASTPTSSPSISIEKPSGVPTPETIKGQTNFDRG